MENNELPIEEKEPVQVAEEFMGLSHEEKINRILTPIMRKEERLSFSALKNFAETPRDFIAYKMRQVVQTPAMIYGSMVHCLVLEPDDFYNRYFVLDDTEKKKEIGGAKPGATKEYKLWLAEMSTNAKGRTLVTAADFNAASNIAMDVKTNIAAARIVKVCPEREQKVSWEFGDFLWHGFKDGSGPNSIFDLKTCTDANPRKFEREIIINRYYLQGAMYLKADKEATGATELKDYYIIAVDKTGGVSCHQLKPDLIAKGLEEYQFLVDKFKECILDDAFDQSYEFFATRFDGIYDATRLWS